MTVVVSDHNSVLIIRNVQNWGFRNNKKLTSNSTVFQVTVDSHSQIVLLVATELFKQFYY